MIIDKKMDPASPMLVYYILLKPMISNLSVVTRLLAAIHHVSAASHRKTGEHWPATCTSGESLNLSSRQPIRGSMLRGFRGALRGIQGPGGFREGGGGAGTKSHLCFLF